jgi:hypothetical protein
MKGKARKSGTRFGLGLVLIAMAFTVAIIGIPLLNKAEDAKRENSRHRPKVDLLPPCASHPQNHQTTPPLGITRKILILGI